MTAVKPIPIVFLATLALAARSSTPAGISVAPRVRDTAVVIHTFGFRPKQLEVRVGTRVVWTNDDEVEHTVTAVADSGAPLFSGVLSGKGKTFNLTFDRAGTFAYQCTRHTFMRGEIRVTSKGDH